MRLVFRLVSVLMVPDGESDSPRPSLRAEVELPEPWGLEGSWVKTSASGARVLEVLMVRSPDWQLDEDALAAWEPGDRVYRELQPGLATDVEGVGVILNPE